MSLLMSDERKATWARVLIGLFMSASLLAGVAGAADAAPMKACKRNPENFSIYKGKCLSDKRIEFLKDRAHGVNHR